SAPHLRIIATSRVALGIAEELVQRVDPLSLAAATQLLEARLRALGSPSPAEDAQSAALIVRELEGLPLALELVAPRVAMLGLPAVAARIERQSSLLASERAERHGSMRAALEVS